MPSSAGGGPGTSAARPASDEDLVGAFRRFGEHGPAYEVLAAPGRGEVEVRVLESGEVVRYAAAQARRDPEA